MYIPCISHAYFLENAKIFQNEELITYIKSKIPSQIIEPTTRGFLDLFEVFSRDNENELHYIIDNYWNFARPKTWFVRLYCPSTTHISVIKKLFVKLNIVTDLMERPLTNVQEILIRKKYGQDIGDYIIDTDNKKRYLYDMSYIKKSNCSKLFEFLSSIGLSQDLLDFFGKSQWYKVDDSKISYLTTENLLSLLDKEFNIKYSQELKRRNKLNIMNYILKDEICIKCKKYGFTFGPFKL